MASRSLSRELALLVLGQVSEQNKLSTADLGIESLLEKALESLTQHWREALDSSASELDHAQQRLLDSELQQGQASTLDVVRDHLRSSLCTAEQVLNGLSATLELPRLLLLSDQEKVRSAAMERIAQVIRQRDSEFAAALNEYGLGHLTDHGWEVAKRLMANVIMILVKKNYRVLQRYYLLHNPRRRKNH